MITILPYCHIDGVPTLRDSDVSALYRRMEEEGSARRCFPGGHDRWVNEILTRRSLLYVVLADGEPGGMLWLNDFRGRYAHSHLVVFRKYWGREHLDKGRRAVRMVLDANKGLLDGFLAAIPNWNRLAIRYARDCGFTDVGVLPFGYHDVVNNISGPAMLLALGGE